MQQAGEDAELINVVCIWVGHPQEATDADGSTSSVECVCSTRGSECR